MYTKNSLHNIEANIYTDIMNRLKVLQINKSSCYTDILNRPRRPQSNETRFYTDIMYT
jgi:hypothetical protein